MKNVKKTVAGITAFAMMLALASCSSNGNEESGESGNSGNAGNNSSVTIEQVMEKSYKAIEIDSDVPVNYINTICPLGDDGTIFVSGGTTDSRMVMYTTDSEFLVFNEIPFELEKPENGDSYYNALIGKGGKIYLYAVSTTYGMEMPDWDDENFDSENFDWEAFYASAESVYKIYTIDKEGNILSENEITGLDKYLDSDDDDSRGYIGQLIACGDALIVSIGDGMGSEFFVQINEDGELGEEVDIGEEMYNLYSSITDNDGNVWFSSYDEEGNVIKKIDADTLSISKDVIAIDRNKINYIDRLILGAGEYKFYITSSDALYGLKEDGTLDEIINWLDSDLNGNYISAIFPVENGEFVIYENDWNTGSRTFYRLTKRDTSEFSNVQVLTLVTEYEGSDVIAKVNEFNKSNDNYRIKVESYGKYYEYDEESGKQLNSPETQLKMDIAAGKTFDIICMGRNSPLYTTLSKKGAFADLYEFMGTDGTVSKDEILPNVLEAGEFEGKLVSLSPTFTVSSYMAKSKFVDKENWTFDDMFETYNNLPDGMRLFQYASDRIDVFNSFVATGGFVDFEKATCSFDSPEFIKLLEFCNGLSDYEQPDWESMTGEEQNNYWQDQETACLNDKALLQSVYISRPNDFPRYKVSFNDDVTLVGYPTKDGNGAIMYTNDSYSIMANSNNKEIAWKFISQFFEEKYQTGDRMYSLPSLKTAFSKKLDEGMEKPYYTDENGKKHEYENTWYVGDQEIKIPPLTKEERDDLERYILTAKASVTSYYGTDIGDIVSEEVETYFKGGRSAEETANIIQNRVSILVSEQY